MATDPATLPADPLRRLRAIMDILRGPDGCPWDRAQDHRSLRSNLLEETYEVLEVLDTPGDPPDDALAGELGDLLLQVVFHARLAAERGAFDLDAVADRVAEKLLRRHPHVFGDVAVEDADEVLRNWEQIKRDEGQDSALSGVPVALPALARADRVLGKAERSGFAWQERQEAAKKMEEEYAEFAAAVRAGKGADAHVPDPRATEFGDLLLALVGYGRWLALDAEACLREAVARFQGRFERMESEAARSGVPLTATPRERLLALWDAVKE